MPLSLAACAVQPGCCSALLLCCILLLYCIIRGGTDPRKTDQNEDGGDGTDGGDFLPRYLPCRSTSAPFGSSFYLGIYRVGAHVHPSALPQRPMCAPAGSQGTPYAPQRAPRAHHMHPSALPGHPICTPACVQGAIYAPQRTPGRSICIPARSLGAPDAHKRAPGAPHVHPSLPPGRQMRNTNRGRRTRR